MKHDMVMFIIIMLCGGVYLLTFAAVWIGTASLPLLAYLIVFAILLFLTYMFLHGAYHISHVGEKVEAEFIAMDEMRDEEFRACFGRKRDVSMQQGACIAKYGIDGKTQHEIVDLSKLFGYVPGKRKHIYVIRHKMGVKVDYEVITQKEFLYNFFLGVPFLVMTFGWVILFLCRGI